MQIFKKSTVKTAFLGLFILGLLISPNLFNIQKSQVFAVDPTLGGGCFADPVVVKTGQAVTWHADIFGGKGLNSYIYSWSGSENLNSRSGSLKKTYETPGVKNATVKVRSGSQQIFRNCTVTVLDPDDVGPNDGLEGGEVLGDQESRIVTGDFFSACTGEPSEAKVGEIVNWTVLAIHTSTTTPQYLWSGTDGLLGNTQHLQKTYNKPGEKVANVIVVSGNKSSQALCKINVTEGEVAGIAVDRGFSRQLFLLGFLFLLAVFLIILFFSLRRKVIREEERHSLAYEPAEEKKEDDKNKDISVILQDEARKSDIIISVDALKTLIEKSNNNIDEALVNLKGIIEFKKGLPCPVIEGEERCDVMTESEVEKYFLKKAQTEK